MRSVLPETFEPVRRQFRVPGRVLDIAMPEVMLDGSGILAIVGSWSPARLSGVWSWAPLLPRSAASGPAARSEEEGFGVVVVVSV